MPGPSASPSAAEPSPERREGATGSPPVSADELPLWVPGEITLDSAGRAWNGVRLRSYRYDPSDVSAPPLRDYLLVAYTDGTTSIHRRCSGGGWRSEQVGPGSVSLLTQALHSQWRWSEPVAVNHLYLSVESMIRTATDVYERSIRDLTFRDVLRTDDSVLCRIAAALAREARGNGTGERLAVEALATLARVTILRHHADVTFQEAKGQASLSIRQCRHVAEFVEANLAGPVSLAELAAVAGLSPFHFTRAFRRAFDCPPHIFLTQRRLARAVQLLRRDDVPLKAVAVECGFADQSHMTRLFRRFLGSTPAEMRRRLHGG